MNNGMGRTIALAMLLVYLSASSARSDNPATDKKVESQTSDQKKRAEKKAENAKPGDSQAETEQAKVRAAKVAAPKAAQNANAQNDAAVQQWQQQFRPMLASELRFVRQMCDLSVPQRPKIKSAGEAGLKKAAVDFALFQQGRRNVVAGAVGKNSQPNPRKTIHEAIEESLKESLPAGQLARYTAESDARTAQHKRAGILSVVSRLDGILCLTADQREKVTAALVSNCQNQCENWLAMHQFGDQYFPLIPDQYVVGHLTNEQKSVWQGLQKIEFGSYFGAQGPQELDDSEWWGEEPAKPEVPAILKSFGNLLKTLGP